MSNILPFKPRRNKLSSPNKPMSTQDIADWQENDIERLMIATGKTREEAIDMASDFYRKYPALIEMVRDAEFMANKN